MTTIELAEYGKEDLGVIAWRPDPALPALRMTLKISVGGNFLESYTSGDNSAVLPSDTLRRHALSEISKWDGDDCVDLTIRIGKRTLKANSAFTTVSVEAQVEEWPACGTVSFSGFGIPYRVASTVRRGEVPEPSGGFSGLGLMATRGSAFTGFLRDDLTVQTEADDRPLVGTLDASWQYSPASTSHRAPVPFIAEVLRDAFSDRPSNSVQQLIFEMAVDALTRIEVLASIQLTFRSDPLATIEGTTPNDRLTIRELGRGPVGSTSITLTRSSTLTKSR